MRPDFAYEDRKMPMWSDLTRREVLQAPTASFRLLTREPTIACKPRLAVGAWRHFLYMQSIQYSTLGPQSEGFFPCRHTQSVAYVSKSSNLVSEKRPNMRTLPPPTLRPQGRRQHFHRGRRPCLPLQPPSLENRCGTPRSREASLG